MDRCLTLRDFERRAAGELSPQEQEQFSRHLAECEDCRRAYEDGVSQNEFLLKMKSVLGRQDDLADSGTPTRIASSQKVPLTWSVDASAPLESSVRDYLPRIEGYVIRKILGRGGMGVVYEAVQTKLNRTVALKLLPAILSSSHPQTIERFHREASAAAKLHHRNIISIYDFGESRDGYYYAMELIEGQPISTVIKRLAADPTHTETEDSLADLLRAPDSGTGSTKARRRCSPRRSCAPSTTLTATPGPTAGRVS